MTSTETTFLEDLADAQVTYVNSVATKTIIRDTDLLSLKFTKVSLLAVMVEIIAYWFRDTNTVGTTDENFFTTTEIQDVIDHANKIMGTVLYLDLSDY